MKNIKNKLFAVGVSALTATPLLASCVPANVLSLAVSGSNELYLPSNGDSETKREACTVTIIGKDCTVNKCPIIARATDCNPKAVHLKLKHFAKDEIANKTIVGKLGLKYKMPEHTYAYTSCPLSDKTSDDPVWATGVWENNGINEMGVGTSSTLTCGTNKQILSIENESFITEGVGEEMLTTIMTPQASSAKHAMQIAAKAIDDFGAQDANIILSVDQNEAWLMEIYSRHQYCAVRIPDDKVCIAGNEFILDSLHDLGINETNKDDRCITSAGLLSVVQKAGLAQYIEGTTESEKDIFHLDLFNTYAREGRNGKDQHASGQDIEFNDRCHMRTWRGYSLFDKSAESPKYEEPGHYKKFAPFLTPKNATGEVRDDLTVYDVFNVYRDEFDELVDPMDPRHDDYFIEQKQKTGLRPIAVETTRQVHIMSSDPTKPKWMSANEWYVPSSGNYVPFLQFNNAVQSFDGEYGYYPNRFEYDENCSAVLFRNLNKLAWYDRDNYGYPLQDFWSAFEYVYCNQMQQVTNDVAKYSEADAKNILTNFNKHIRDIYAKQVKKTKNDLMWHIMDMPQAGKEKFVPLVDLETYVKDLGWNNYRFDGTEVTFDRKGVECRYTVSDGSIYGKGLLKVSDGTYAQLRESIENNRVYVDANLLIQSIGQFSEIREINVNDYLSKPNKLAWLIPTVVVAAAAAGVAIYFLIKKRKPVGNKQLPEIVEW